MQTSACPGRSTLVLLPERFCRLPAWGPLPFVLKLVALLQLGPVVLPVPGAIPTPADAPLPLPPLESQKAFQLAPGFQIQLLASGPLITEPTGVCWDERGRLYVCELHGYNLEGQLEIEAMNRSGTLDTTVQRVQADARFKNAAQAGTFGVVKRLFDTDGDGVMDRAQVLASNLPPAYGICPARGGIIVAGQAEIVFLADRDDDGVAEERTTVFTGWRAGALERGINAPQWGPDGWIYFGRGWGSDRISGPKLREPVQLPNTDFRIRPDGSAIEPVGAGTHTIGLAFAPSGDRFFTTTWKHALYAVPIPWRYLERNPDVPAPSLEADASDYTTVYPVAPVHPWKQARATLPGWKELYAAYGIAEAVASGYFTSCCSPLFYQSALFPPPFFGNLLVCEPAQSLVHRCLVELDGPSWRVRRPPGEEKREFLASTDSWFRPVQLAHAPDGSVVIVDMYREIIEDYSAVPRFMQQQYGLSGGVQHGRLWRLAPETGSPVSSSAPAPLRPSNDLSGLSVSELGKELESGTYWRRVTAERLLREREGDSAPLLTARQGTLSQALDALDAWISNPRDGKSNGSNQAIERARIVRLLQTHDRALAADQAAARRLASLAGELQDSRLLLQAALSLGYSREPAVFETLTYLARRHARLRWMPAALLSGLSQQAGLMLAELLRDPGSDGAVLLEPLAAAVAARRDSDEVAGALVALAQSGSASSQAAGLKGLRLIKPREPIPPRGVQALARLMQETNPAVQGLALGVASTLQLRPAAALSTFLEQAARDVASPDLPTDRRLAAVALLAASDDPASGPRLLSGWANGTPQVRAAIVDALLLRPGRLDALVNALENDTVPAAAIGRGQRERLLERANSHQRPRIEAVLTKVQRSDSEALFQRYTSALAAPRNVDRGGEHFQRLCASCHQVNDLGTAVGPGLSQAFQRPEETLIRDILFPSELIASGYESYTVTTADEEQWLGILVNDSPTSVTLRMGGGLEMILLRNQIVDFRASPVSLMPEGFAEALSPADCADLLGWLRAALSQPERRGSP